MVLQLYFNVFKEIYTYVIVTHTAAINSTGMSADLKQSLENKTLEILSSPRRRPLFQFGV